MPGQRFSDKQSLNKRKGGSDLDDKNKAVMGDADDDMDEDDDQDEDDEDQDETTDDEDGQDTDDLNDNANGDMTDNGADDNADGGEDDADDVQQPNPKLVARRGAGKTQRKPIQMAEPIEKANEEPIEKANEEPVALFDADVFFANLTKAIDTRNQQFLIEYMPSLIDQIVEPKIAAIRKQQVALTKAMNSTGEALDAWFEHYDERTDDLEERNVQLKKSLDAANASFTLVKSHLGLEDGKIVEGADGKPSVEPLEKALGGPEAAAGGKILEPNGSKPNAEAKGAKAFRLIEQGEKLQEKLHKSVDGLTDMVITAQNLGQGQVIPNALIERLEEGVKAAEDEVSRRAL
jgi:hypothetical protein